MRHLSKRKDCTRDPSLEIFKIEIDELVQLDFGRARLVTAGFLERQNEQGAPFSRGVVEFSIW